MIKENDVVSIRGEKSQPKHFRDLAHCKLDKFKDIFFHSQPQ